MQKKILALLSGGAITVSSLFMSMPATVQAATVKFEECEDSNSHIRTAQAAFIDGLLTVTIDIDLETEKGNFDLYVFTKQLERPAEFAYYDMSDESRVAETENLKEGGTYTFDGLADGKTYYVYCRVSDNHEAHDWGECNDPDIIYWHNAAYLGSFSSGSSSSDNTSSGGNSSSCNSSEYDDEENTVSVEEAVSERIRTADSGSTIVMEKGVTSLSNSTMKALLKKGDVSLKLAFTYQDKEYVIIIPAGAALDDDIPWYGPLYLAQHFGNSAGTSLSTASETGGTYEVQPGDSLSKIAAANHMTLKQLLAMNPQIKDPNKINAGQKINR